MPKRFGMNDVFGLGQSAYAPLILDQLSTRPYSAWSFARRMSRRWRGPVGRLYRTSDGDEIDIYGRGRWGLVDPNEIRAFNGWNLLRNSSNFHLGGWSSVGVIYTTGLQGPTGASDAIKVAYDTNSNLKRFSQSITLIVGLTYCSSIYAKADPVDTVAVRNSANTSSITWDLTSGTVTSHIGSTYASPTIESVGGGWFRLSFAHVAPVTPDNFCWWGRAVASSIGDGVGGTLFARAQVEVASSPTTYEPRTTTGAGNSLWTKLYDQTGAGRHFEQASNLIMPYSCRQGVPVTENGIQSAEFVAAEARRMAVLGDKVSFKFMHTTGGSARIIAKPNNTSGQKSILANKTSFDDRGFRIAISSNERINSHVGKVDIAGVSTAGTSVAMSTDQAVSDNSELSFLLDPDSPSAAERFKAWINNSATTPDNIETGVPFDENHISDLHLGSYPSAAAAFDGTITEVAIWNSLIGSGDRGLLWADASNLWVLA